LGNDVFGTNSYNLTNAFLSGQSGERVTATFTVELHLGHGNYALSVALHAGKSHLEENWDWWDNCAVFQILPGRTTTFVGLAALPVKVDIQKEDIHD
jgi:lipopolysaccharide transport system ATP-binding protein